MAKKKDEKDVLIVRDEKTGEISVVAGLNADGSPKRTPAKVENSQAFLQFDKHGDMLDNFFKNFFRQCKEPTRFGFYRIAAEQVDQLLDVMKELLKNPVVNKDVLSAHLFDTSEYERQAAQEQKTDAEQQKEGNMEEKQENENGQEQSQGKKGYQPIDEGKINWQELEDKWGVRREELDNSGDLTKMLNYGKSDLVKVTPTFGGESFELDARLSFRRNEDGSMGLVPHFIRKEQKLDEYKGHKFSAEDKKNLRETGNMGRVVDLVDKETGEIIPSIVSIDRKTNELTDLAANKIRVQSKIGETEITRQEQTMLRAGLPVKDKHIVFSDGREFITTLQANVEKRGPEFVPGTTRSVKKEQAQENKEEQKTAEGEKQEDGKTRRNTWVNEDGSIRSISKWSDVKFTEQQKADYVAGKAIRLENVTDKQGSMPSCTSSSARIEDVRCVTKQNPDTAQQVAPANESRTQVAVNNEGKTNEATKNLKDPLQKGQTAPKDDAQRQQQEKPQKKSKGMRV